MLQVAVSGKVKFIDQYAWIQDDCKPYESEVVESPTWMEVCQLFNDAIHTTGDTHHVYLEGLFEVGVNNGVKVVSFSTGS